MDPFLNYEWCISNCLFKSIFNRTVYCTVYGCHLKNLKKIPSYDIILLSHNFFIGSVPFNVSTFLDSHQVWWYLDPTLDIWSFMKEKSKYLLFSLQKCFSGLLFLLFSIFYLLLLSPFLCLVYLHVYIGPIYVYFYVIY